METSVDSEMKDCDQQSTDLEIETESHQKDIVDKLLNQMIETKSLLRLQKSIDFLTACMSSKDLFFQLRDFYHYFCCITESSIGEQYMESVVDKLNLFYEKTIDICYEWKCLSNHFESDYRFYNCVQLILKSIIDKLNDNSMDDIFVDKCIPLMLTSMLVIVSTIHGIKEVVVISRPITTEIVLKRKTKGLDMSSNDWKRLISCLRNVCDIWSQINTINGTDDKSLSCFVVRLVDFALSKDNLFLSHISAKALKCLSREKSIPLDQLFIEYQYEISLHILDLIRIGDSFDNLGHIFNKTMHLFGINCLPHELLRHIVPPFAIRCDDKTKQFIEEISKIDNKGVKEIVYIYFNHIIRYMFYSNSFEKNYTNLMKVIDFLSRFTNFDIKYRIKFVSYDIINSLLMNWSKDHNSTLEAIAFVQYVRQSYDELTFDLRYYFDNESELRTVLKEFFLPFIHKLDSLMQDNSVCSREKLVATESFVLIIDFMAYECINTFRVKVFSTIKLILSERFYSNIALIKLSIEAMMRFIKMIDDSYLSSQLLTISALMLPLMHFWPIDTSNVFKEMIIKHKLNPSFQSAFKHLYFIPEMPQLIDVTEVLKPYISCGDTEEEICDNISLVVNNINHENSRVQEFSLRELRKLLTRHQTLIYKKCNNIKEFNCDYFVNQIVAKLMLCLKSNNKEVLLLVTECLGILGAIDPLRIEMDKPVISKEDKCEKFLNANETEFKVVLITQLYRAITSASKTEDQYCASYALQEIIKLFTSDGFKIEELPQELRDYCAVLQKTRYNTTNPMRICEVSSEPIFGSSPDLTYQEWLNKWLTTLFQSFIFGHQIDSETTELNTLLSQSSNTPQPVQSSDQFETELAKALANYSIKSKVLIVCFLALLRNQSVAQFLLPYIVITALKNAKSDEKSIIVNEMKTIITKLTTDDSIFSEEIGHLSSQTVFHIYDYMKIWIKNRDLLLKRVCNTARHLKTAKLKDKEYKGVRYFLDNISNRELSVLASKCNAFSRSLRYLEDYVKPKENEEQIESQKRFQEEISLFQKVFIRLDEPDSVDGCNSKRIRNPNINEKILTHEAMGQIQEALVCCAKAVELNSNQFECHEKYLKTSMDSFDQSELVYTYGTGLMIRHPEWQRRVAPYVIEAVWKLGDWEQLDQLLTQHEDNSYSTFGSVIGDLFCAIIKKKEMNEFEDKLMNIRQVLAGLLSAAAMEISGYVRGHEFVVDLHILNDIQLIYEKIMTELDEEVSSVDNLKERFAKVVEIWDQRNDLVRNTIKCQEPILNSQRALFSILTKRSECADLLPLVKKELFKSWLLSTKTSRKSGNIQRSYNCLLEMNKIRDLLSINYGSDGVMSSISTLTDIENSEAIIETAKVNWNKNNKIGAIHYLKSQIEQNYNDSFKNSYQKAVNKLSDRFSADELLEIGHSLSFGCASTPQSVSHLENSIIDITLEESANEAFAKLQLLYTKYCDKSAVLNQNTLAILYKSVTIAAPEWEESHYNLGMYCHKIYTNYEESKRNNRVYSLGKPEEILEMKGRVVKSLVESLKYGVKHVYDSLPLLLNIWLDLGTELHQMATKSRSSISSSQLSEEVRKTIERINNAMNDLVANVPVFIFFVSFAQLTARVLHPIPGINAILKKILMKLIYEFPQQSMWLLMRSINSNHLYRRNCFNEILQKSVRLDQTGKLQKFINDIKIFGRLMTEMCQKNPDMNYGRSKPQQRVKQLSFRKDFPELSKLFQRSTNFSRILLPFSSLVNITLPKSMHENNYNPFPSKDIYIDNFDDCIDLLHSLQRPKKIKICGSDGKTYTILCKPGDDLRKDYCLIELTNLLNRCFKRDSEARRRQLRAKTYLVVSLTDTCGLIEWIPGLIPIRTVIEEQYRDLKDYDAIKEQVIRTYPHHTLPKKERVRKFQNEILPKFQPSVFANWFVTTYTDPLSWFSARLAYIRSCAVFSVVGYLLGLGDRHGENILIEELSGETVHVDLNCMFNKGEEFQVPERVPFRLTHNMVAAMGVTEFEGTFRKACEHTLRVARDNKEALMNFVNPFRFDHLAEWGRKDGEIRSTSSEYQIDIAEKIVFNIEARLNGIPSRNDRNLPKGIALSVEGQIDQIIKESTDINNLGVMYVGWTPYI